MPKQKKKNKIFMNSNNIMDSVRKWVNGWWKGSRARNSDGGGTDLSEKNDW